MKSDNNSKATGFLKLMQSHDIIAVDLFQHDVLTVLHKISLKFQQDGSVLADVSLTVKTALSRIKSLEAR